MKLSALDENGNPVDWWFAYKIPKLIQNASTPDAIEYEYVYYDPNVGKVDKSSYCLSEGKGAVNLTLSSVFDKPADTTGWLIYNDEMSIGEAGKDDSSLGHPQSVIAFDSTSKTAFWLLHSWFEHTAPGAGGMPPLYGQTFLCISLDMETASKIIEEISNHQEPDVYLPNISTTLEKNDVFCLFMEKLNLSVPEDSEVLNCISRGGLSFKVIVKKRKWGKDFWLDLIEPTLGLDIDVETWGREESGRLSIAAAFTHPSTSGLSI